MEKEFKDGATFICDMLDLEHGGPAEPPAIMQGPDYDLPGAYPTLNEDGTTVDEVPYTSDLHRKLLKSWVIRESAEKRENIRVHTRIRYDPNLADVCGNDKAALSQSEDGFYLIQGHLRYLNFAAHSMKWPAFVHLSYERLLTLLRQAVESDVVDKDLPHEVKVSINSRGEIEVETFEVEPRYHLYQGLLEYERDDEAAAAVARGELPDTYFAMTKNGGYDVNNKPVDTSNGFVIEELDPAELPSTDKFLTSIPERFRQFSTVREQMYDLWVDKMPIAPSYFTTFYTSYDAPYQRALERMLSDAYPEGLNPEDRTDVILYNARREIMNCTDVCIAVQRGGVWVTPYICSGGVCDVMRTFLLEQGLIVEADIAIDELRQYEYVLVFNSVIGIMRGIISNHPPEPVHKRQRKPKESKVIRRTFDDIIEDEQDAIQQSERLRSVVAPKRTKVRGSGILRF